MKQLFEWLKENLIAWLLPLALMVIGFGATFLDWKVFFDEGDIHPKIAFFAPLVGFLGLAMLLSPAEPENILETVTAARRRERRQRLALITLRVGLMAGGVSFALMNGWIGGLAG